MELWEVTKGGWAGLAALGVAWGVAVTLFWMWVAWRAMRAHERLADAMERFSRKQTSTADDNPFRDAPP